jgi:hypothetical protein
VISVKPWLIPNCDPTTNSKSCPGSPYYLNSSYALNSPGLIGQQVQFSPRTRRRRVIGQYYLLDMSVLPGSATVCPSASTLPANSCSLVGSGGYHDDIACGNRNDLSCGSTVQLHTTPASLLSDMIAGTQCLIHTNVAIAPPPPPPPPRACPDPNDPSSDCFVIQAPGSLIPVQINGGQSNPNTALQGVNNISRSDSIVTVPIFDGAADLCTSSCPSVTNAQVIGFLQLGIQYVTTNGDIGAVILNVAGCNPAPTGTAVSGSGVTPIPVRLIHN